MITKIKGLLFKEEIVIFKMRFCTRLDIHLMESKIFASTQESAIPNCTMKMILQIRKENNSSV